MPSPMPSPKHSVKLIEHYEINGTLFDTKKEATDEIRRLLIMDQMLDWFGGSAGSFTGSDFCNFLLAKRTTVREILGFTLNEILATFKEDKE